ncbi:MAG TPA: hypothetical protein VNS81_06525 [Nocardioides sp.]|nr:hypothetical protein [Nocardioides sp.]
MTDLEEHVEHFRTRVLQDALAEATAKYWLRRAETFAAVGTEKCDGIALACRNRALQAHADWHHDGNVLVALQAGFAVTCSTCGTSTSPWSCSCGRTRVGGVA